MLKGEPPMDDDALIPIGGNVCPECLVVVHCDYSRSYLREKALVDGEVEVIHHCDTGNAEFHMNTVTLNATQLDRIRDLLSKN
jgi:hypothetical protein